MYTLYAPAYLIWCTPDSVTIDATSASNNVAISLKIKVRDFYAFVKIAFYTLKLFYTETYIHLDVVRKIHVAAREIAMPRTKSFSNLVITY